MSELYYVWNGYILDTEQKWEKKNMRQFLIIDTVEKMWNMLEGIQPIWDKKMYIYTRSSISPMFEENNFSNGQTYKFICNRNEAKVNWESLVLNIMSAENEYIMKHVQGFSISIVINCCKIQVWTDNSIPNKCLITPHKIISYNEVMVNYTDKQLINLYKTFYNYDGDETREEMVNNIKSIVSEWKTETNGLDSRCLSMSKGFTSNDKRKHKKN